MFVRKVKGVWNAPLKLAYKISTQRYTHGEPNYRYKIDLIFGNEGETILALYVYY